jgi:CDP-diacylglycerol--glycerol-3-phosphate 3-phosphatidyltransferase
MSTLGMDPAMIDAILAGREEDHLGLWWKLDGMYYTSHAGLWLLWIAAALTLITGVDYLRKSMLHLKG